MANLLSQLITDRLLKPAIDAGVEKALSQNQPPAYGVSITPEISLSKAIGQPHDANYALLYSLYKLNVDVAFGVHAWKGSTTSRGWHLDMDDENAEPTDAQQQEMAGISNFLRRPNPFRGIQWFLESVFMHLAITGDDYWYVSKDKNGKPLEVWHMHPALTKVIATKQGEILGYVMKAPGDDPVYFEPEEVLHFTTVNPNSDIYGEGPVELVLEESGIDLMALRSNKAIFINGMNPSAVVMMDETAKKGEAQEVTDRLKQAHAGSSNQHKVVALSKVKDFKPWTYTHRDMEYLGLRNLSTTKVARGFRMPVFLFGEHNAGDFATAGLLVRETHQNVYIPLQNSVNEVITNGLIRLFNPLYCFKLNQPDSSNPDELRRDYMQAKRDGIVEVDEARERGFGLNPLQNDTSQPANGDDDQEFDDSEEATKSVTKALSVDEATTLADSRAEEMDTLAESVEPFIVDYFATQQARYLDGLPDSLDDVDGYVDSGMTEDDSALLSVLLGAIAASLTAGSQAAQLQIGISLGFNQTNPFVQEYLSNQALQHVKGINQTTRDQLRATLKTAIANEESIDQLRTRIQAVFTNASDVRANTIARTETAQAFGYANHEVLQQMYDQGVINARQWLTAQDDRVRPNHAELHGYIVRFGNQFPGGIEPGSEINCRCTEIGVMVDAGELS